jgi:hypothetical protein
LKMELRKQVVICGNCRCRIGITFEEKARTPRLFCAGCEQVVTHLEEIRQAEGERYKAAARAI